MPFLTKARQIIQDSIKSAIFIDEKAREMYAEKSETGNQEEDLSLNLYNNFKEIGVSLAVHKFSTGDEKNENLKKYLLNNRDLVLLDWKLDGESGEDYSLKILSDIINSDRIHFGVIYTSEHNFDNIFSNILAYFSCKDKDYYDGLKELLEVESGVKEIVDDLNFISLNRNKRKESGKILYKLKTKKKTLFDNIISMADEKDDKCALIRASIALSNTIKSPIENMCPTLVDIDNKILVINNTIITIQNKGQDNPEKIIDKLTEQVISQKSSFTQLLSLEMQTLLAENSSYINTNMLDITKDAFIQHRNHHKDEGMEYLFSQFVKDILLEHINSTIQAKELKILDSAFLDSIDDHNEVSEEELISMNVFYNSGPMNSQKKLNFGDVFVYDIDANTKEYFICITALCDCLRPCHINNSFYFAKGTPIKQSDALSVGDSAFISYIDKKNIIKWSEVDSAKPELLKYRPVYIKPKQIKVINPNFDINGELELSFFDQVGKNASKRIKYLATIKPTYTQRIANHAFTHSTRVGVDFVKK